MPLLSTTIKGGIREAVGVWHMASAQDPVKLSFDLNDDAILGKLHDSFQNDGFLCFPQAALTDDGLRAARQHLEMVFQGAYDLSAPPTKPLKVVDPSFHFPQITAKRDRDGAAEAQDDAAPELPPVQNPKKKKEPQSNSKKRISTLQIINIWHCDSFFRDLTTSPTLGELVASVCGWRKRGCRLAQDQVWVKPPGAGPLSFHRDTTYFDFVPKEVATVWFTFDSVMTGDAEAAGDTAEIGPLEYCRGSHLWGYARRGSVNQFFDPDYHCMLRDAAQRELATIQERLASAESGVDTMSADEAVRWSSASAMELIKVAAHAGGFSIHNGNTWHGSSGNKSQSRYRRGIGIHYIPGDALFNLSDLGTLWKPYVEGNSVVPPEKWFPWVFRPET